MRKSLSALAVFLLAAPFAAFAQLDDDTLTVTASRTAGVVPDQVVVGVTVDTPAYFTLDDVLGLLGGAGITAANLAGSYTGLYQVAPELPSQWVFSVPVPFEKLNGLLAALAKAEQKFAVSAVRMSMSYYVQGSQVSPQLQAAHPCAYTSLLSDAERQAQNLAAAAGVRVGPVLAIWDGSSAGAAVPALALRQGDFASLLDGVTVVSSNVTAFFTTTAPACTMTVQFRLLR